MDAINDFISAALPYTEWPMFILLILGGLFLVFYSKFLPYRFFGHAMTKMQKVMSVHFRRFRLL